jgi:hypothetical protein
MVFGKKKLKPSHLAPPPPKEPAKAPDRSASAKTPPTPKKADKKPRADSQPPEKRQGLIEPLEDRQHI